MEYRTGSMGRVFVAKIGHEEDLLEGIKELAQKEHISSGIFFMLGAVEKAAIVTGPVECTVPPEPNWTNFSDGRELIALGTLFPGQGGEPDLHIHGAYGKGDHTYTGCLRDQARVYLVTEVILMEITGIFAARRFDSIFGIKALELKP